MKLPISIAESLLLLQKGDKIPYSRMRHEIIEEMLERGILEKQILGRSKALVYLPKTQVLSDFLQNIYGIQDLQNYIDVSKKIGITRAEAVAISADSKLKTIRTFKGFLINCYCPIQATIDERQITINPIEGTFQFIYDFEKFYVPQDITIVGIENPENFRYIDKQKYLFDNIKPLFVSRYPQNQSKDLIKWLQSIPNQYLHFGDFDFAGISIYLNECKKYLADKASFLIPENIEELIANYGNRKLYDVQKDEFNEKILCEMALEELINLIHKYKKGLEQEIFIYL
jgi:hypothetical protein